MNLAARACGYLDPSITLCSESIIQFEALSFSTSFLLFGELCISSDFIRTTPTEQENISSVKNTKKRHLSTEDWAVGMGRLPTLVFYHT